MAEKKTSSKKKVSAASRPQPTNESPLNKQDIHLDAIQRSMITDYAKIALDGLLSNPEVVNAKSLKDDGVYKEIAEHAMKFAEQLTVQVKERGLLPTPINR